MARLAVGGVRKNFGRSAAHDEHRVALFAGAHQHLARAKLAHRDGRYQQSKLIVVETAQKIYLAQAGHQFPLEVGVGLVVCVPACDAHIDGAGRERNLDRMTPERVPETRGDAIAHVFLQAVVGDRVLDSILDREIGIVPSQNFGRRIAQHLRHVAQQREHHLAHVIGRYPVADSNHKLVTHVAGGVVEQRVLGNHGVGNFEPHVGARYDRRCTPCDSLDPPEVLAAADPVTRIEGAPYRQRQAAENVAQRLLQGEAEDGREDGRGGQDRKWLHAEVGIQHHHHHHEPQHEHQQVFGDAREVDLAAAHHCVDELEHQREELTNDDSELLRKARICF